MDALFSLLALFFFLVSGMLLAKIPAVAGSRVAAKMSGWVLYALLFFMGYRVAGTTGADQLAGIGRLSLVFALSAVAGTLLVLYSAYVVYGLFTRVPAAAGAGFKVSEPSGRQAAGRRFDSLKVMKDPLKLLLIVFAGFAAGYFLGIPGFTGEKLSAWLLRFLLLSVGMDLARSGVNPASALARPETVFIPVCTAAGSIAGAVAAGKLAGISAAHAAAVASGFGWYSLSGVLITDMGDPYLGSVAFLSNILRESVALALIPLLSKTRYPGLAIGAGGATSMDVTLPLIERCCGIDYVPASITSGAILSLLVPVLVPLFFGM